FYETPQIDSLARDGMKFSDAYAACPVCSPSRAAMMTGKYPARLPLTEFLKGMRRGKLIPPEYLDELPLEEVTVAKALKEAGYTTGHVGKWHLGKKEEFWPEHHGFDVNIGGYAGGHPASYFSPYQNPRLPDGPPGEYLTDRLTDEAIRFLKGTKNRPFFLNLWHYAPHTPLQAKETLNAKFQAKKETLKVTGPEFIEDSGRQVRQVQSHAVYAAMVASIDESTGRILRTLEELGLDKNTIVIFTSDNGGLSTSEGMPTSNVPLRTGKGWPYEGGVRVPLLIKWPGVVKPGSVTTTPVSGPDFYPTFLRAANAPLRPQQHLDGVDITPLLKGGQISPRPLFWHYPHYGNQGGAPCSALRDGDWKLIEWFEDNRVELYNLHEDIGEHQDLARTNPEKANALKTKLHQWRTAIRANMPTPNPDPPAVQPSAKTNE
ncbi:MAG: sulfatase, partial [Armatimonadota bacterium]